MSSVDVLVQTINKQFKKNIVSVGGEIPEREFIPFSTPSLNYLTRGGVCENKMVEFSGKEGSAKTTLALDIIKNFQLKYPERLTVYLDAENTLDTDWASNQLGVDMDRVIVIKPEEECGETLLDMLMATIRSGEVGLAIVDSVPFLVSKQAFENTLEQKTYGGNSALMSTFCSKVVPLLNQYSCTLIVINQVRDVLNSMYAQTQTCGGHMLKHSFVQRLILSKSKYFDEKGNELTNSAENPCGHTVTVKLEKNKVTKNDRKLGTFTLNYSTGIDAIKDTIDLAIYLGLVNRSGAWFSFMYNEQEYKYQGKVKLGDALVENPELYNFIKGEVEKECSQR